MQRGVCFLTYIAFIYMESDSVCMNLTYMEK